MDDFEEQNPSTRFNKEVNLDELQNNEELLAQHKKRTEKKMRVIVALLISLFAFTLWFLLNYD
jgi:hypothetical protein